MDCRDVQRMLRDGRGLDSEAARAHLDRCAPCRLLVEDGGRLAQALRPGAVTVPEEEMDALRTATAKRLAAERGLRAWGRSLPDALRFGLAAAVVAILALGVLLGMPRADLAVYPGPRMIAVLAGLALLTGIAIRLILRPLHRPALPRGWLVGALVLGVLLPLIAAGLPAAHLDHPASLAGTGDDLIPRALACFVFGLVIGLPVVILVGWMERRSRRTWMPLLLSGAAAGLAGNLALQLHCPLTHPIHLLAGHATVSLAFLLVMGGAGLFFSRRV